MSALKPCPFCGSTEDAPIEAIVHVSMSEHDWRNPSWTVQCDNCTATMGYSDTEEEAIAAWNTRTPTGRQALRDDITARYENTLRSLDDGWRLIETAPTDWTQVDLWVVWQGLGQRITDCRSSLTNGKPDWHTTSDEYGWTKVHGTPTHWMPLPAPPALPAAFRRV